MKKIFLILGLLAPIQVISSMEEGNELLNKKLFKVIDEKGSTEQVLDLIKQGADVNAKDKEGRTPLIWAASKGQLELCNILLDKNDELNKQVLKGIQNGWLEDEVKKILKNRVNVDAQSSEGETPLMGTAKNGYIEICKLLIKRAANINIKDKDGFTPLCYAVIAQ